MQEQAEGIDTSGDPAAAADELDNIASEVESLGEEAQSSLDSLSEAFPNGCPAAELLEQRVEACERIKQEIEDAANEIRNLEKEEDDEDGDGLRENVSSHLDGIDWSCD